MDESVLNLLRVTKDPVEKAATIAEFVLSKVPESIALVARRCVVLHWFDLSVVKAVLKDCSFTHEEIHEVFDQLAKLPFIETMQWGLTFQDLTRQGLIERYSRTQPDLLKRAAALGALSYEVREYEEKVLAEAFFCRIIAGEQETSRTLLNRLLKQACDRQDWFYIANLFSLEEEAEHLPFVLPISLTEEERFLRDLVNGLQGKLTIHPASPQEVLEIKNAFKFVNQGTKYASQSRFEKALVNYNKAIQLHPNYSQAYAARGVVYAKLGASAEALHNFNTALRFDPNNTILLLHKGKILNSFEQYEESLAIYEQILSVHPINSKAHVGQGTAFIGLKKYEEALAAFEQAIFFAPNNSEAYDGKGIALSNLNQYLEAQSAFERARQLDHSTTRISEEQQSVVDSQTISSGGLERILHWFQHADPAPMGLAKNDVISTSPYLSLNKRHIGGKAVMVMVIALVLVLLSGMISFYVAINLRATAKGNAGSILYPSYLPGSGAFALYDPLKDDSKGYAWNPPNYRFCNFQGDALHVNVFGDNTDTGHFHPCIGKTPLFSDFAYQIKMTVLKGDCGGIVFRSHDPLFYYYYICQNGQYGLVRYQDSNYPSKNLILREGSSSQIHEGLGQANSIAVLAQGHDLYLYVNHVQIDSTFDTSYIDGAIGVLAKAFDLFRPTEVAFNDAMVWTL